jgi:pyridinium-3,5-bisthiocarboxylic acid mononucleotide nickel chelatase
MRIAYFDTIAGISGDMALGALIHAGLPLDYLRNELSLLPLTGYELETRHLDRSGIQTIKFDVNVPVEEKHGRHLSHIHKLIAESGLPGPVIENASAIFTTIGTAEAKIHNIDIEKIHFHEVGAMDSIVDVIGTTIGLDYFGIEGVYSSPVKVGNGGTVRTAHGTLPVPSPATMEILRGYPIVLTDIPFELTTPTGAAIIKTLSGGVINREKLSIDTIGYGSGSREIEHIPNILRLCIGNLPAEPDEDEVTVLETNIDDMNPEVFPYVIDKLLSGGARDAFVTPVIMKKGRPGILLTVLVSPQRLEDMTSLLYRETTTIGIRYRTMSRKVLSRAIKTVDTPFGKMKMKEVEKNGKIHLIPEFEECRKIAEERNIPLIEVYKRLGRRE